LKTSIAIFVITIFASLTHAASYTVKTIGEYNSISTNLNADDTVRFAGGIWNDTELTFKGNGKEGHPIVFMADNKGELVFSGTPRMHITGSFLEVRDFILRVNAITEEGSVIEFRGVSGEANHCRLSNVTIEESSYQKKSPDTKWVSIYGTHNRVDHCSLSGKTNSGTTLVVWLDKTPDYHLIDHNYFGPREELGVNGAETIRIGTSDWERHESNCTVENNLFEACDGETEIISNKSVGNTYRYNTFRNCAGTLTLRHGSDCSVYGNFFFGDPEKECGGIRLIGPGHKVYNNYLENLTGMNYRAAICLANGVPNSPANRYRQVENALVAYNTIVNCKQPFSIGAGKDDEKSLPPINSKIGNNLVIHKQTSKPVVAIVDKANTVVWQNNLTNGKLTELADASGFQVRDITMERSNELLRPAKGEKLQKANPEFFKVPETDVDGQKRNPANAKVGCDESSESEITVKPLVKAMVGANYNN